MIPLLFSDIAYTIWDILNDVSPWLIASFVAAGLLRQFLNPAKFQSALGNRGVPALIKATLSGMLLPICSCGVIPLGLGMYYTGAYLGPTLAFMVATPIINPAAILLAYGLLGPQIATIYLIAGFVVPVLIGMAGNLLAGGEIQAPGMDGRIEPQTIASGENVPVGRQVLIGIHWGLFELGTMTGRYIVFGVVLAGILIAVIPPYMIQGYLGSPGMISISGIAAVGSIVYVCAVGHIPFVAALVASGAAPGVAITFLMTGAATNLPELISIYKMIGKRAVMIYSALVILASMAIGRLANGWLMPGFVPFYHLDRAREVIGLANRLIVSVPDPIRNACSIIVLLLFLRSCQPWLSGFWKKAVAWDQR